MRVTNLLSSAVKCPDPLTRGSGPWTPLGAPPPDPHIGSRSRARHILTVTVLFLTGNEPCPGTLRSDIEHVLPFTFTGITGAWPRFFFAHPPLDCWWKRCCFLSQALRHANITEWGDVTESMVTIRSPCCGYNSVRCVQLKGEDLWSCLHKTESASLTKCRRDH